MHARERAPGLVERPLRNPYLSLARIPDALNRTRRDAYEFVILGSGCAGLSLCHYLHEEGVDAPILILDRRASFDDDRTWCFWDVEPTPFSHLALKNWCSWSAAADGRRVTQTTRRYPYLCVTGHDFYEDVLARLARSPNVTLRLGEDIIGYREGAISTPCSRSSLPKVTLRRAEPFAFSRSSRVAGCRCWSRFSPSPRPTTPSPRTSPAFSDPPACPLGSSAQRSASPPGRPSRPSCSLRWSSLFGRKASCSGRTRWRPGCWRFISRSCRPCSPSACTSVCGTRRVTSPGSPCSTREVPDLWQRAASLPPLRRFARDAAPLTLAAIALLAGLYLVALGGGASPPALLALYLVLISALTLPHFAVVSFMDYRQGLYYDQRSAISRQQEP